MKKVALVLCMILSLVACKDQKAPETLAKPVVKIGASFPLLGNMAAIGNAAHKALVASINDVNKNKNNKYRYVLITDNDQMDAKYILNIANKFIFQDKVDVLISYFSVAGRIVAPLAAEHKIINFNFGFGDEVLQSKYNFQNFLTVEAENEAVISFLKKNEIQNVDLVYQNIGAADQFLAHLEKLLEENKIAYTVYRFNKGERDFKILTSKIKESLSEAVFIYAFEPEADILTQEFRTQNVQKLVAYNDGLPMTNNYEIYDGYYNIGSIMTPEKYQKEWGLVGENAAYAVYLYDTGQIIAEAYENAPTHNRIPSSDEISAYLLSKQNYFGLAGNLKLDQKGQFHSKGQTTIVKNNYLTIAD